MHILHDSRHWRFDGADREELFISSPSRTNALSAQRGATIRPEFAAGQGVLRIRDGADLAAERRETGAGSAACSYSDRPLIDGEREGRSTSRACPPAIRTRSRIVQSCRLHASDRLPIPQAEPRAPARVFAYPGSATTSSPTSIPEAQPLLITVLGAAFIGGLILNLMPCVLPVLSLKVFSLIKHAGENPKAAWVQGVAFTAGVVLSFWVLAGVLLALRAAGNHLGWGFQMQSPGFVLATHYSFLPDRLEFVRRLRSRYIAWSASMPRRQDTAAAPLRPSSTARWPR